MKLPLSTSFIFAFLFSGCVQKEGIEEIFVRYERRTEVRNSQGTLYRVEDYHLFALDDEAVLSTEPKPGEVKIRVLTGRVGQLAEVRRNPSSLLSR